MQARRLIQGSTPLLISAPHMGTFVPPDIKRRLTPPAGKLPDTDWHVDRLYDFARDMGAGLLTATHSRYVIDLNRPQEDTALYPGQVKTGLVPLETFDGAPIYLEGEEPDNVEKLNRISAYWLPYHETLEMELARLKKEFGFAVLYDAHSIKSSVPRLFNGILPDLNIGTVNGKSCAPELAAAALEAASGSGYSAVLNGRFIGGHITRHYGRPDENIHAVQMELSQKNYMDEETLSFLPERAEKLQVVLNRVLAALLDYVPKSK